MESHFNLIDLIELLITFMIGNIASESLKYFVTKVWVKIDSKINSPLDVFIQE